MKFIGSWGEPVKKLVLNYSFTFDRICKARENLLKDMKEVELRMRGKKKFSEVDCVPSSLFQNLNLLVCFLVEKWHLSSSVVMVESHISPEKLTCFPVSYLN